MMESSEVRVNSMTWTMNVGSANVVVSSIATTSFNPNSNVYTYIENISTYPYRVLLATSAETLGESATVAGNSNSTSWVLEAATTTSTNYLGLKASIMYMGGPLLSYIGPVYAVALSSHNGVPSAYPKVATQNATLKVTHIRVP